jgi:2-succinyl-6-hydroxy-2,4-cyclohexadiene-1-carboxylate synthase
MKFQSDDGVNYHLHTGGAGDPLVALHGFTGTGQGIVSSLAGLIDTRRIVAPDLLGHGETDAPADPVRYTMERAAADLAALIDHAADGCADVFGYSMGGRLALYLALAYPARVRTLILESASPGLESDDERAARRIRDDVLANQIECDGCAPFVEQWERLPLFATQTAEMRAVLRPERLSQRPEGLANSLRGMGTGVQPSLWGRLGELQMPVSLLTGADDPKFTAINVRMAASIPSARHIVIADAGHTPHIEQPAVLTAAIGTFLADDEVRRLR